MKMGEVRILAPRVRRARAWVAFSPSRPHRDGEKVPKADEGRSRRTLLSHRYFRTARRLVGLSGGGGSTMT